MDATNPFRAALCAAALAAAGCASTGAAGAPTARSQAPFGGAGDGRTAPPAGAPVPPDRSPAVYAPDPIKPVSLSRPAGPVTRVTLPEAPRVKVVAVCGGGSIVTDEEVRQAVAQRPDLLRLTGAEREQKEKEAYRYHLKQIIERELVIEEMTAKMKKAKPGAMDSIKEFAGKTADKIIRSNRKSLNVSEEQYERGLAGQGVSLPFMRRQLERDILKREFLRSLTKDQVQGIGLADVRDYYARHPDEFQAEDRVKWLDIFVSFRQHGNDADAARRYAERVHRQAAAGADFLELVQQYDQGTSKRLTAVPDWQKPDEIFPPAVAPTVLGLKAGEVSGIVEAPTGYHVMKVYDRIHAGVLPFDEKTQELARAMATRELEERAARRLVDDLWRRSAVQVFDVP